MFRLINSVSRGTVLGVVAVGVLCFGAPALAQPPGANQMCGDGTTFTVSMPTVTGATGAADSIEVPRGCSIYLVIASDYGRNRRFDELLFYPLAKYVAEHNGYVHYAWWNNFLKPYMAGALHPDPNGRPNDPGPKTTIGMLESVFGLDVIGLPGQDEIYLNDVVRKMKLTRATIGFWSTLIEQSMRFIKSTAVNVPDDEQFVADAGKFITAVRANNPHALVFMAGHGFGAHAIVKVGKDPLNTIDLLAPIDPMGNESLPVAYRQLFEQDVNPFIPNLGELKLDLGPYAHTNPQSRWRAVFNFKGYQTADCVRGAGPGGLLCRDFDPRLFFFNLHCLLPNPSRWQKTTPVPFTRRPFSCPGPLVDPGTRISLGANVGFLYHRYQQEWGPPIDFGSAYHYGFRSAVTQTLEGPNVQGPVLRGDILIPGPSPYYVGSRITCQSGEGRGCSAADGHDEIAGFRGEPTFQLGAEAMLTLTGRGVHARDWASDAVSAANLRTSDDGVDNEQRRLAMIEMASLTTNVTSVNCDDGMAYPDTPFWNHAPCSPDDCLVCEDLVTIATNLAAQSAEVPSPVDTTAPSTLATTDPEANAQGWHQADVVVTLQANDDPAGSGVKQIQYSTQAGTTIQPGSVVHASITSEGTTQLSFFATDHHNNSGAPTVLQLKLDKTLPQITALTDVQPNPNGWFKTDVTVSFSAVDGLSGLAAVTPDTLVTSEGAGQEVPGTATDNAENQASASVTLNIDKSAPTITLASKTPGANAAGWNKSDVAVAWNCTDGLSGAGSPTVTQSLSSEGAGQTLTGTCVDLAHNAANDTQGGINIDKTAPSVTISAPAHGAVLLLNGQVTSTYSCSDSLSGVHACNGPVATGSAANTSSVGSKLFTVSASDVAGNTTSATNTYSVQYAFSGFAEPIGPMPMRNVVNAGRTVPVKYFLQDANGALMTDLATFVSLESAAAACNATAPSVPAEETTAPGSTEIRWDEASQQFHYNWKTEQAWAGTCRVLRLTLNDGTQHVALFQFR